MNMNLSPKFTIMLAYELSQFFTLYLSVLSYCFTPLRMTQMKWRAFFRVCNRRRYLLIASVRVSQLRSR